MDKINVLNKEVSFYVKKGKDYISLTDIAKYKNLNAAKDIVKNWLRNKNTIEFLGLWKKINNENFKGVEFDSFWNEAGLNSFVLSPKKWIQKTNAIGLISKSGKSGGTFAHKDIAFEFASWISAEFKLYLIKEFQRLKEQENSLLKLDWNVKRILTKINYNIHTNAIKENLIPLVVSQEQKNKIYASEAEVLNIALFGMTSKEWKEKNNEKEGNLRDYANVNQLVCLSNLESLNSVLINEGLSQSERLLKLNQVAISQMRVLVENRNIEKLE